MKRILRVVLVVLITAAISNSGFGEVVTIRIRFINGRNGKPIARKQIVLNDRTSRKETELRATDNNGYVEFRVERNAKISANVERSFHRNCDQNSNGEYSVATILALGLADSNGCGGKVASATPGELIRVVRRSNFIESLEEN